MDPVRGALIAIAPLLLAPPRLVAIALLIADTSDPAQLRPVLLQLATGKLVLLGYLAFSCGQAAFPSCGDHVGMLGALALTATLGITVGVILSNGGRAELTRVLRDACLLLSVPAIASGLSLLARHDRTRTAQHVAARCYASTADLRRGQRPLAAVDGRRSRSGPVGRRRPVRRRAGRCTGR
jgi:hypothetical protein